MDNNANSSSPERKVSEFKVYDRRYVGSKETFAYLLNDFSNAFNIGQFTDRFIWDIVKIDFKTNALVSLFTGAWDVINDPIIAALVDKTRTRWGKFKPYLVAFQIPMTLLGALYWFLPFFFPGTTSTHIPKLFYFFAFNVVNETAGTFTSIAKAGYMTTITPHPNDRTRLITMAELLTGYMGEDLPNYIMGVLIDLINNNILKWKLQNVFLAMGLGTSIISSLFTLYFFFVSRERVMQSIEAPSVKQGLRAVVNNYPVLLITISDFLGGFSVSGSNTNYFIDVLGSASLLTVANIPSGLNGSISYAFVKPVRERFSSKAIWVFEDLYTRFWYLALFAVGTIGKNYQKPLLMTVLFGVQAWFDKWAFGIRKVVKAELYNEAMDYCEWKNGYRVEATIGVARNLITKLQNLFMNSAKSLILDAIGYKQGITIGTQTDKTKWWLFALCTGIPQLTGILAVIPKFLYPLSGPLRNQMYSELMLRRREMSEKITKESNEIKITIEDKI